MKLIFEMQFKLNEFLLLIFATVRLSTGTIRPSDALSIMGGEGFTAYLELPKSFGSIENCWLKFEGKQLLLLTYIFTHALTMRSLSHS